MTRKEERGAKMWKWQVVFLFSRIYFQCKEKNKDHILFNSHCGTKLNWKLHCWLILNWDKVNRKGKRKDKKIHLVQKMSRSFQMPDIRLNKLTASLNHQHFLSQTCQEFSDWLQLYHFWDEKNLSKCKMLFVITSLSSQKE